MGCLSLLDLLVGRPQVTAPFSKRLIFTRFLLRYITMTKCLLVFHQFGIPLIKRPLRRYAPLETCIIKQYQSITCCLHPEPEPLEQHFLPSMIIVVQRRVRWCYKKIQNGETPSHKLTPENMQQRHDASEFPFTKEHS